MKTGRAMLVTLFVGMTPMGANAEISAENALGSLVSLIEQSGYTNVTVVPRLLSGYVIEAEKDDTAILLAVDADTYSVSYTEVFEGGDTNGFFSTAKRPPGGDVAGIVAAYTSALADQETENTDIDLSSYRSGSTDQRTAGFFQDTNISIDDEGAASIKRTETLGVLNGVTRVEDTTNRQGGRIEQSTTQTYSLGTETVEREVIFSNGSGFSSDVFVDRDAFTESIVSDSGFDAFEPEISQDQLIDRIVLQGGTAFQELSITNPDTGMSISVRDAIAQNLETQRLSEQANPGQ